MERILLSFVGSKDSGNYAEKSKGAIRTVFERYSFDNCYLIITKKDYEIIGKKIKTFLQKSKKCKKVYLESLVLNNPTDHNEIYPKLLDFCKSLKPNKNKKFTAAIASGTPAMQVCWVLMAESGDFPVELVRSNEPKFGGELVTPVKLGTGLPRIIRLQEEVNNLKKLIPELLINIKKGLVVIDGKEIKLALMEFCYYRYFAERITKDLGPELITGFEIPRHIIEKVLQFHKQSFPYSETRFDLEQLFKKGNTPSINTFSSHKTNINKKIKFAFKNSSISKYFMINDFGKRFNKEYGLIIPADKIKIIDNEENCI